MDLSLSCTELTAALVDVESVSGDEQRLADEIEQALRAYANLAVERIGNVVLARTEFGAAHRVVLAGHLDTVPIADNLPSRREGHLMHGCGTSDMKAGDAVIAHLAATLIEPRHDLTLVFYDCEEVEAERNGLGRIEREHRDWLAADLAVLPMAADARAVAAFVEAVAKPVCVMIETPAAVLGCPALAAVPGVVGLIAGTNDLCAATGIRADAGRAGLAAKASRGG